MCGMVVMLMNMDEYIDDDSDDDIDKNNHIIKGQLTTGFVFSHVLCKLCFTHTQASKFVHRVERDLEMVKKELKKARKFAALSSSVCISPYIMV